MRYQRFFSGGHLINGLSEVGCLPGVGDRAPILTSTAPQEVKNLFFPNFVDSSYIYISKFAYLLATILNIL